MPCWSANCAALAVDAGLGYIPAWQSLITGPSCKEANELTGKTGNMRPVHFPVHPRLVGQFVDGIIIETMGNWLRERAALAESGSAA